MWTLKKLFTNTPKTQDVNWTYIRRSEDVLDVLWTSYVRLIYVLCLWVIWLYFFRGLYFLILKDSKGELQISLHTIFEKIHAQSLYSWECLFCYLKSYNMQHVLSAPLSWNSVFLKLHMDPDFLEKVSFWGKSPKIPPNEIFWFLPKIYCIDIFLLWCSMVFLLFCKNRIPENNILTFSSKWVFFQKIWLHVQYIMVRNLLSNSFSTNKTVWLFPSRHLPAQS